MKTPLPKNRNPIARVVRGIRNQTIPDKRFNLLAKENADEVDKILQDSKASQE